MNLRVLSYEDLCAFTSTLSTLDWHKLTEKDFAKIGLFIASDGCSGVPDFYLNCCILHDWFYRTHRHLDGSPITKLQADKILKECDQRKSILGKASIIARLWYWGVRNFGKKAWQ